MRGVRADWYARWEREQERLEDERARRLDDARREPGWCERPDPRTPHEIAANLRKLGLDKPAKAWDQDAREQFPALRDWRMRRKVRAQMMVRRRRSQR